jgi:hypothetical protein
VTEHISSGTILTAILALNAEISQVESKLASDGINEADLEADGEALLEAQRAFGELVAVYKNRRQKDPGLPDLASFLEREV